LRQPQGENNVTPVPGVDIPVEFIIVEGRTGL
jgi:hypothetical protein